MSRSSIEWTDSTWNPIRARRTADGKVGWHCEKISAGCANCYSETFNRRELPNGGTGFPYAQNAGRLVHIFADEAMLQAPLRWKKPRKVFVCSMTDLFADFVPLEFIDKVFAVMALCPQHTFQVLTKRPERMREYFSDLGYRQELIGIEAEYRSGLDRFRRSTDEETGCAGDALPRWQLPLSNVWLGISAEDQPNLLKRAPYLIETPAAKHFISYEPALGPIDLHAIVAHDGDGPARDLSWIGSDAAVDWVISGSESGPHRRPAALEWFQRLNEQCVAAGVPHFHKQRIVDGKLVSLPELDGKRYAEFPK